MNRFMAGVAIAAALSASARAQIIVVNLHESASGAAIPGAVVRLMQQDRAVNQALTNASGRAGLQTLGPGRYRVRVSRIGYSPVFSDFIDVAAGETKTIDVAMPMVSITLPAVAVQTESQCGNKVADNDLAGAIWEQVRTALTANVVTTRERETPIHVREFRRELTKDADLKSEVITRDTTVRGAPYASPNAKTLVDEGYAVLVNEEMTFSAPDADLFLSDEFATTHCFRAVAGPTDSIVGLAFEPVPRRRQSDVRGTLWINRVTSELRFIEFAYVNIPVQLRELGLGGRVDFKRLASGAWIVSYWHIRMPEMADPPPTYRLKVQTVPHLAGYVEVGGRAEATMGIQALRAIVRGTVFDSTTMRPMPAVTVRVIGEADSVLTDSAGRYALVTTKGGPQTVAALHPKLGLVDQSNVRDLMLSLGATTDADFAVPTAQRMARGLCGGTPASGIIGQASAVGPPTEGLDIRVIWGKEGKTDEQRAQSGPKGLFVFCDLPIDTPLRVQVLTGASVSVEREALLKQNQYLWVDLRPDRKP
jgi:hypothetical protein